MVTNRIGSCVDPPPICCGVVSVAFQVLTIERLPWDWLRRLTEIEINCCRVHIRDGGYERRFDLPKTETRHPRKSESKRRDMGIEERLAAVNHGPTNPFESPPKAFTV